MTRIGNPLGCKDALLLIALIIGKTEETPRSWLIGNTSYKPRCLQRVGQVEETIKATEWRVQNQQLLSS